MHDTTRVRDRLHWRAALLPFAVLAPLVILYLALPPIVQEPGYHAFADSRTFFGVPNFWNVVSNVAFVVVGWAGLKRAADRRLTGAAAAWCVFFAGLVLVGPGSAWYHFSPSDETLVWDRLPMTIAFSGALVAIVAEHLEESLERRLLLPAIAVGVASVLWWRYSGDLKLYAWVQLAPMLAAAYALLALPPRYSHRSCLLAAFLLYALSKAAEVQDAGVYAWTGGTVSGHVLKHLLAALAAFALYWMVFRRRPLAA
jgi:hypothetical protein